MKNEHGVTTGLTLLLPVDLQGSLLCWSPLGCDGPLGQTPHVGFLLGVE